MLTKETLNKYLIYDCSSGVFVRRIPVGRIFAGSIAGSRDAHGYLVIRIEGKIYKAHRLAWLYVYGAWPEKQIDHIDGNKTNNAISNLRDVSNSENQCNQKHAKARKTTSESKKYLGVTIHKMTGKYQAHITLNGKQKHIGLYTSAKEAHKAYLLQKQILHTITLQQRNNHGTIG